MLCNCHAPENCPCELNVGDRTRRGKNAIPTKAAKQEIEQRQNRSNSNYQSRPLCMLESSSAKMETEEKEQVFKPFEATTDENGGTQVDPPEIDDFDPFQVGTSPAKAKAKEIIAAGKKKSPDGKNSTSTPSSASRLSNALPPRLEVKFKIHEEVSSLAAVGKESEGSSDVTVDGTVLVRLKSTQQCAHSFEH